MCRLLAVVANKDVDLGFSLIDAKNSLKVQAKENSDGWGIAAFNKGAWTVQKEPLSALDSKKFIDHSKEARGTIILSHVRQATVGKKTIENTHPFQRQNWVFAHNGTVANSKQLVVSKEFQPEGSTDSERIFCAILTAITQQHGSLVSVPKEIVTRAMRSIINDCFRIDPQSKLNLLLSDGARLFVHRHGRPLHWLERSSDSPLKLDSELLRLYEAKKHRGEKAILVATERLTGNLEKWQEIPEDNLFMIDQAALASGLLPLR